MSNDAAGWGAGPAVPLTPLLPDDPPKIGDYWIDARLTATPAGVAYTGHAGSSADPAGETPAMVILLSEGAAADPAARDRLAGVVNQMWIDTVLARGGQGQDTGKFARKYRADTDDPIAPDDRQPAPWVALAYDGSPAAAQEAARVLDEVELATLPPSGSPSGPDYRHYWRDRVQPGLARMWPLPWPGRYDRAGWRTILVSWLLMLLLGALAVLIAILIFHNLPPQAPPTPTGGSGSPPPQSSSSSPQSGSPSPQSGSPSPQSGSPSPQSGSPSAASPSGSPSRSGTPTGSPSSSPSPSGTQSGPGQPSPTESGTAGSSQSPPSRL
ncbi:hypothetical protein FHX74_003423 [Friedmanniella endophytica]|uniref:Uncharacterized protein n=1 Tax=Microlunatus kandeliicorticis TaxID=1759536 RepID=A0A7W3IV27_9ACTN|nr:hypothetical protein [Microlunatus kandeliicorticis]MBA8795782.1 hypothetical protein [Microlunatus kandeliicorticis]